MKEITPEQQKQINKLGMKFLVGNFFSGVHHALMLIVINFILVMSVTIMGGPEWVCLMCSAGAAIFIFRRLSSITKESHDRLITEINKIIGS